MLDGYVHPAYAGLADRFRKLYSQPGDGGGALAAYQHGHPVVDVWTGYADEDGRRPWERDTMVMCFSTTKGVASTVIHRLADRGLLEYDAPVAEYWPQFGVNGKQHVTVRHLMTHRAGLHNVRDLVTDAKDMLDHERMIELLAELRPRPRPGKAPGYHGFTYGWLLAGLARGVTGKSMGELAQEELAIPLGLDGLYIGTPDDQLERVAKIFPAPPNLGPLGRLADRFKFTRRLAEALIVEGFGDLLDHPDRPILNTEMPAANGVFTARSLARMYGALAGGGRVDGVELLSSRTVLEAGRVQTRQRDYVLGLPMRWRLGYHQAFTLGPQAPKAFGHFGFGGSGAWADPETRLSLAFVTNRMGSVTTPMADARLVRLNREALRCAEEVRPRDLS